MPAAKATKCASCNDSIAKTHGSIKCSSCNLWLHLHCADVSEKHLALLKDKPSFSFTCAVCLNASKNDNSLRDELRDLKTSFNDFVKSAQEDRDTFKSTISEMFSELRQMKSDLVVCSKLIEKIDSSTTAKINNLMAENNVLHRRLNRGDIVLSGLPSGLNDLSSAIISLCSFYGVNITDRDINYACYMSNRKLILAKFNNVSVRDNIMSQYFKTRSLKVSDIIGGEISGRVYLNDHYSPAASNLNALCRKLLRQKVISKFKILNADKVKAKLTMPDGAEVFYDLDECTVLYKDNIGVQQ